MVTAIMIGNKIADARKMKNMSQSQLAEQMFISSQAVGKWERGESMPDIMTFNRLAKVLGVDLNYFSEDFHTEKKNDGSEQEQAVKQSNRPGFNMSGGNWIDADFSGLKNLHEKFNASNMQKCLFKGSDLSELQLKGNYIKECDISGADLGLSRIESSQISNSQFIKTSLKGTHFKTSHINDCDFTDADFGDAIIEFSTLQNNDFSGVNWTDTAFRSSGFVSIVLEGKISDCSFENCDFRNLTFRNAFITNTFFKGKKMKKIRFIDCRVDRLTYAFLKSGKADLTGIEVIES